MSNYGIYEILGSAIDTKACFGALESSIYFYGGNNKYVISLLSTVGITYSFVGYSDYSVIKHGRLKFMVLYFSANTKHHGNS